MAVLRAFLAAALCLGLVVPASAAPPAVRVPAKREDLFAAQSRPFKIGDVFTYRSETQSTETGDAAGSQTNKAVFDLEVIGLDAASQQPVMRFTLREIAIVDPRQPGIQNIMSAFVGVPVDFNTVNGIHPVDTLNGPAVRRQVFANLGTSPADAPARAALEGLFGQLEAQPDGVSNWVAADVNTLGGMFQPFIPKKPLTLPTTETTLPDGSVMVRGGSLRIDSVDAALCQVTYSRESQFTVASKGYEEHLQTQASLASDAMPVKLTQTQTKSAPGDYRFKETVTMTRLNAPPGCN
ncbi:MAG: hypothetical protein GC145_01150 [Caulobacter sp.]|nr:hypothetical protein [Caulobacter sp.]